MIWRPAREADLVVGRIVFRKSLGVRTRVEPNRIWALEDLFVCDDTVQEGEPIWEGTVVEFFAACNLFGISPEKTIFNYLNGGDAKRYIIEQVKYNPDSASVYDISTGKMYYLSSSKIRVFSFGTKTLPTKQHVKFFPSLPSAKLSCLEDTTEDTTQQPQHTEKCLALRKKRGDGAGCSLYCPLRVDRKLASEDTKKNLKPSKSYPDFDWIPLEELLCPDAG